MANVNTVYELMLFVINKNQNGYFAPEDFDRTINQAQVDYITYLLGVFQQYTPGRPIAKVELGNNQTVRQRLTPVIYEYNLTVDGNGSSPYPGDYLQTDAMWTMAGFNRIRFVQQDSLFSYYNSTIDPIQTNPIYLLQDAGLKFYPSDLGSAKLSYIRTPPAIHWGYTLDVNDRPVYDPTTSADPIWNDTSIWEIVARALKMVGVDLQAADVSRYADEIKQLGV